MKSDESARRGDDEIERGAVSKVGGIDSDLRTLPMVKENIVIYERWGTRHWKQVAIAGTYIIMQSPTCWGKYIIMFNAPTSMVGICGTTIS